MSIYKSKYVTISSNDIPLFTTSTSKSALDIKTKFGNQSFKLYSGYSFSQISFINNFYNVTSLKNKLKIQIYDSISSQWLTHNLIFEPGYYFIDDLADELKSKVLLISPLSAPDVIIGPTFDYKLQVVNFKILPKNIDSSSDNSMSELLGFTDSVWSSLSGSKDGFYFASHENKLLWHQVAYLNSQNLKSSSSMDSLGNSSSVVACVPVDSDFGSPVFYTDHVSANTPHHLFNNKKDITEIDFQLCDVDGNILECSDNNLVIALRMFQ